MLSSIDDYLLPGSKKTAEPSMRVKWFLWVRTKIQPPFQDLAPGCKCPSPDNKTCFGNIRLWDESFYLQLNSQVITGNTMRPVGRQMSWYWIVAGSGYSRHITRWIAGLPCRVTGPINIFHLWLSECKWLDFSHIYTVVFLSYTLKTRSEKS